MSLFWSRKENIINNNKYYASRKHTTEITEFS